MTFFAACSIFAVFCIVILTNGTEASITEFDLVDKFTSILQRFVKVYLTTFKIMILVRGWTLHWFWSFSGFSYISLQLSLSICSVIFVWFTCIYDSQHHVATTGHLPIQFLCQQDQLSHITVFLFLLCIKWCKPSCSSYLACKLEVWPGACKSHQDCGSGDMFVCLRLNCNI